MFLNIKSCFDFAKTYFPFILIFSFHTFTLFKAYILVFLVCSELYKHRFLFLSVFITQKCHQPSLRADHRVCFSYSLIVCAFVSGSLHSASMFLGVPCSGLDSFYVWSHPCVWFWSCDSPVHLSAGDSLVCLLPVRRMRLGTLFCVFSGALVCVNLEAAQVWRRVARGFQSGSSVFTFPPLLCTGSPAAISSPALAPAYQ